MVFAQVRSDCKVKSYPSCERSLVVCFSRRANEAVNVLRPLSPWNFLIGRRVRRTEKPVGFSYLDVKWRSISEACITLFFYHISVWRKHICVRWNLGFIVWSLAFMSVNFSALLLADCWRWTQGFFWFCTITVTASAWC